MESNNGNPYLQEVVDRRFLNSRSPTNPGVLLETAFPKTKGKDIGAKVHFLVKQCRPELYFLVLPILWRAVNIMCKLVMLK